MQINKLRDIYSYRMPAAQTLNQALLDGFTQLSEHEDVRKTHFFGGRYENIYIDHSRIPEIDTVLSTAIAAVAEITGRHADELRAGLWFNAMEPGHVTTAHRHDDDDEIYSAVYYVKVPENSGHIILMEGNFTLTVQPEEGMFVFFPPDMMHEVTINNSDSMRLSLGINIGPAHDEDDA